MKVQREKAIQAAGVQLLRSCRAEVYITGTRRPSGDYQGTCMTPGIADVFAFLPQLREYRGMAGEHWTASILLCWEAKAPGGRMSEAQRGFQTHCENAGIHHVVGDLDALIAWLVHHGYLKASQAPARRQRVVGESSRRKDVGA